MLIFNNVKTTERALRAEHFCTYSNKKFHSFQSDIILYTCLAILPYKYRYIKQIEREKDKNNLFPLIVRIRKKWG